MNNKLLIGLLVLLVGLGAGWYVLGGRQSKETGTMNESQEQTNMPAPNTTGTESEATDSSMSPTDEDKSGVMARVVVTYTDTGFGPATVTVKKGTTVSFMNDSSGQMWVASAPHPTHSAYPEFDQKASVAKGGSYEFTFDKVGTWKYHNHVKATDFGSVTVTE